jgi:hypothetical protein
MWWLSCYVNKPKNVWLDYQSMTTRECYYVLVSQSHPVEDIPQV